MQILIAAFLLFLTPLSATYLLLSDGKDLAQEQKRKIFDLMLQGEEPRALYELKPIDLKLECHQLAPQLRLQWIPPSLWQLAVLHAFFHNHEIHNGILACSGTSWNPLIYDEMLHSSLASAQTMEEIIRCFDHHTLSLPELYTLFFQVNDAAVALYQRAGSEVEMMRLILSELPPFKEWKARQFPFWQSTWIYNPNSAQLFYNALQEEQLLYELMKIERIAHEQGEWVLYRGYLGSSYPSTLQQEDVRSSHALSFGSTLLGGTFFSVEACALTYSQCDLPSTHSFLVLRASPQKLKEIFRIGPLHPFVQMLVDGEMFHAHTKVAASRSQEYQDKPLYGYFMECNKHCSDPLGYVLNLEMTAEEQEEAFLQLCQKSGYLFQQTAEEPTKTVH